MKPGPLDLASISRAVGERRAVSSTEDPAWLVVVRARAGLRTPVIPTFVVEHRSSAHQRKTAFHPAPPG